eukprot:CAMPEP_0206272354 /NCGR_PEP_ID=MMETSP0047_2-20121206/33959_1 /ASSEMBLY_ACC=CAM_ASM_000192 /TAXON_ID=195065 /ORGANISM="Chroomonas mesostigmatica_cf, Strain CCMP1168" /LENGTH=164 /DNA_ID=CAMNT_0053701261 /DNA_START=171 /DNA_END=661 /DNA_ORIENTATION=-
MKTLAHLEHLDASNNLLSSVQPLASLLKLTTLRLDHNRLQRIDPLFNLTSLQTLSVANNELRMLGEGISSLRSLTSLNVSYNKIEELPVGMGDLNEKILGQLHVHANPLNDSKVVGILQKGGVKRQSSRATIKELLLHLRNEKTRSLQKCTRHQHGEKEQSPPA